MKSPSTIVYELVASMVAELKISVHDKHEMQIFIINYLLDRNLTITEKK